MPTLPADLRTATWADENGYPGQFVPNGAVELHGAEPNPATRFKKGSRAARLFVGLNVGKKPRWNVNDVVRIVKRVRREQTGSVGASFLTQRGLYSSGRSIVNEKSVQVVILDEQALGARKWKDQIVELAEALAEELKQEVVIVELQKSGIVDDVYGVKA
jgi:hypothetical protein